MSDRDRSAAARFLVGFDGQTPTSEVIDLIRRGVGGIVLFARNVGTPAQVAELCADLKRRAGRPLLVCVDQEGGRVARLSDGFTAIPSMRDLGATGNPELALQVGRLIGTELRAVNIDLNFAPVLDVDTNPANPVIGARSLGSDPQRVAAMGAALIKGLQENVAACGKHFPGHGDTSTDSHYQLPALEHPMARLREVELPPFRAAIDAGVASIMTAHVVFKAIDPHQPATMSPAVIDGVLRKEFGFDGVIISDDLEMKAIAGHFGVEKSVVRILSAGVDLLTVCHSAEIQNRAIDEVIKAVENDATMRSRIEESDRRLKSLFAKYCREPVDRPAMDVVGSESHRAIARRIPSATQILRDPTDFQRKTPA